MKLSALRKRAMAAGHIPTADVEAAEDSEGPEGPKGALILLLLSATPQPTAAGGEPEPAVPPGLDNSTCQPG